MKKSTWKIFVSSLQTQEMGDKMMLWTNIYISLIRPHRWSRVPLKVNHSITMPVPLGTEAQTQP